MYLIVDKKTKEILYMCNSFPGEEKKPEEIFPSFDPKTMEFGRSPEQYIPVNFTIRDGVVEDATPAPQAAAAPRETIAQARERMLLGILRGDAGEAPRARFRSPADECRDRAL